MTQEQRNMILQAITLAKDQAYKEWEVKTSNGRYDPYGKPNVQAWQELRQAVIKGDCLGCQ